ncbi:mammalian cell entry protein [Mycolicibacterium setense]|uniref:MCE family protein n=1 Tax=Mycolicibacterium setense TaxID=431269 RepID=UPI0007EB174D|nr:MCE family protein [Mycolicibacterium setense]OBB17655.1 mammalian cell entry protein [Mycolicibacterium setense]
MTRRRIIALLACTLVVLLVAGAGLLIRWTYFGATRINAYFTSATGIYPGDEVRVLGVKVGTITAIEPAGAEARLSLEVDRNVSIPEDARAVIVAQNLVSARYVQLAPAYDDGGAKMADGAEIPVGRTAIPVEWDEVKTQLMRLATDLGPRDGATDTSLSRFIDSAANALDGNGEKLRQTLTELAGVGRILADGNGNVVDILKNLQIFISALRDSNQQIVQFQDRLATLTSVLNDNRPSLDAALTDLSSAVGDVQRFIAGTRNQASEQVQRLANITQILVDHKIDLENVLHVAPNAIANSYNNYNPDTGTFIGALSFNNFADPVGFFCGLIGVVAEVTSAETAKLCAQTLGPAARLVGLNNLPIPFNPYLAKSPSNLIYTDPALAPGGVGGAPVAPEVPPTASAYTGLADNPYPAPVDIPPPAAGPDAPPHLPAYPSQALYPGAPIPGPPLAASQPPSAPPTLPDMLLPAEGTPPQ